MNMGKLAQRGVNFGRLFWLKGGHYCTPFYNTGATTAEIVSMSGHSMNSRVLDVYVKPDQKAGKNAAKKRGVKKSS